MIRIHGQIESLKRIRETLDQNGITRFNSTGDITKFLDNYPNEKEEHFFKTEREFELEIDNLQLDGFLLEKKYNHLKSGAETKLHQKIDNIKNKCAVLNKPAKNALTELLNWYRLQFYKGLKFILETGFTYIIAFQTHKTEKHLNSILKKVNTYSTNRQQIISQRCAPKFKELEHTKTVAEDLYTLIAGAIGENLVAKELEKLPDTCFLFNDFSLKLEKPIYYKKENSSINSIQIDHLLVTSAGLFIIETKNWSKASMARYDFRSPIRQIQRVSYALFVLLNPKERAATRILKKHHWGNKKLPIRNIVAMIHHKPKEKFNYVAVKRLNELNKYIEHFEPIFDSSEVRNIADYLLKIKS